MNKPSAFVATVVSNEYIASETRKTVFAIDPKYSVGFTTGQFFNLKVKDKVMRAYSIASSASRLPEFELCVKVIAGGLGSGYIDRMESGEKVEFMGPFGHFGRKSQKKLLMIATGTGIAPMKALCDEGAEEGFKTPSRLVFGVSNMEYASYHPDFLALSTQYSNFEYDIYASRPESGYTGNVGRVTKWVHEQPVEFFIDTEVLICGNPAMVKEVRKILKEEKGVAKEDIIVEAF